MDQNLISLLVRRVQPRSLRGFQFLGVISQEQLKGGRLARGTFSRGGFSVSLCAQWAIRAGFQAQTEELVSRVMRESSRPLGWRTECLECLGLPFLSPSPDGRAALSIVWAVFIHAWRTPCSERCCRGCK